MSIERFYRMVGGRKQLNGAIYAVLITVMALRIEPFPFEPYAMWLAAALLGTSAIVAMEDRKSSRPYLRRRAGDDNPASWDTGFRPHEWADGHPDEGII